MWICVLKTCGFDYFLEVLKDVFKLMIGEMLETGLEGELYDELGYTEYITQQNSYHTKISKL